MFLTILFYYLAFSAGATVGLTLSDMRDHDLKPRQVINSLVMLFIFWPLCLTVLQDYKKYKG